MSLKSLFLRISAVAAILAAVTLIYNRLLPVNPTTVALTFLVLVLIASAFWGFRVALIAAIAGSALFNFFFLPPVGTFTIADPQNWISLFAFLLTAVIASNLAERARRQAELARERRRELEQLYALSQQLLTMDNAAQLLNRLPSDITQTFQVEGAALVIAGRDTVYRSRPDLRFDAELLLRCNVRGEMSESTGVAYVPIRIGLRTAGALALVSARLSRETMEAAGSLIGIATERTRAMEELTTTRAAQESEKLRSALLDSVTHEFRTPLTGIKASVTALLEENSLQPAQQHELLSVIDEETDRLNRLVGEAAEMAQLDAHMVQLHVVPHRLCDLVEAALENAGSVLSSHVVDTDIPADLPHASFDFERMCEVITHLLENAAKYSPQGTRIRISAENRDGKVTITVADQGSGIESTEQALIFEKFYRGREQRLMAHGTGMGLAISKVIVEAHGGTISLVSQVGSGSVFSVHFPAAGV